jgi:hypothetical protein
VRLLRSGDGAGPGKELMSFPRNTRNGAEGGEPLFRDLPRGPRAGLPRGLRLLWALVYPFLVGGGVWLAFQLPFPLLDDWLPVKNVLGAGLGIGCAGVCLYNTLFYDRFRP